MGLGLGVSRGPGAWVCFGRSAGVVGFWLRSGLLRGLAPPGAPRSGAGSVGGASPGLALLPLRGRGRVRVRWLGSRLGLPLRAVWVPVVGCEM